jgi:hypothetical protein
MKQVRHMAKGRHTQVDVTEAAATDLATDTVLVAHAEILRAS